MGFPCWEQLVKPWRCTVGRASCSERPCGQENCAWAEMKPEQTQQRGGLGSPMLTLAWESYLPGKRALLPGKTGSQASHGSLALRILCSGWYPGITWQVAEPEENLPCVWPTERGPLRRADRQLQMGLWSWDQRSSRRLRRKPREPFPAVVNFHFSQ